MAQYQVKLIVDIEADDADQAWAIAEGLGDYLGLHCETTTLGSALEVLEVEEEVTPEAALEGIDQDQLGEDEYDPMLDVNYVGHPIHY